MQLIRFFALVLVYLYKSDFKSHLSLFSEVQIRTLWRPNYLLHNSGNMFMITVKLQN